MDKGNVRLRQRQSKKGERKEKREKIRTHKDTHSYVFTEDHMRTQGEGKQEKAKRKASGKSKLANTLILDFENPEL